MTALAVLLAVAAIVVLLILDDRERREDGFPVLERDLVEDELADWATWDWPGEFRDWDEDWS